MSNQTNLLPSNQSTSFVPEANDLQTIYLIDFYEKLLYALYSIIFVFGFTGNLLVIYVIVNSIYFINSSSNNVMPVSNYTASCQNMQPPDENSCANKNRNSYLKTSRMLREKLAITNFYLLNLAVSDFFYIIFIPILITTMHNEKWIFGRFMCKLYLTVAYLCQFSSVFILVILSIDRYMCVIYPGKAGSFRNRHRSKVIVALSWLLSILFSMPILVLTKLHVTGESTWQCAIEWPEQWHQHSQNFQPRNLTEQQSPTNQCSMPYSFLDEYLPPLYAFTIYSFLFNYLIPVGLISVLYTLILRRLFELEKQHASTMSSISRSKKKSHKRVTKMVLAIIICYVASWSPYWFVQIFHYIYQHLLNRSNTILLALISHTAQVIAYFSSAINPFIYSYMNESFRRDFKMSLFCLRFLLPASSNASKAKPNSNVSRLLDASTDQNSKMSNNLKSFNKQCRYFAIIKKENDKFLNANNNQITQI